jgi:TIR domain-containing protein
MQIYLSYEKEDSAPAERLRTILKPLQQAYGVTVWSVQDIRAGTIKQKEMALHLKSASFFIPLLSADFFASDRCEAETTAAIRLVEENEQFWIMSILIQPVLLDLSPLTRFPVMPGNKKPISLWANKDTAWLNVQTCIQNILKAHLLPRS